MLVYYFPNFLFVFKYNLLHLLNQISQLNVLIMMLTGTLSAGDRQKIMTVCTIEVHNRDVVSKLISQKVENSQAFTWLSQLRHRWDDKEQDCYANICDAQVHCCVLGAFILNIGIYGCFVQMVKIKLMWRLWMKYYISIKFVLSN